MFKILSASLLCLAFLNVGYLHAEKEIPYLNSPVIDDVGILNPAEKENLGEYIRSQKDLLQMQVWITTLDGESVEGLSIRAVKKWALGTEKRDNGVLLLVAPNERRMRIEVGRGLEGDIPDILAGRILDLTVRPQFRQGAYYQGIRDALDQLVALAGKGPQAEEAKKALAAPAKNINSNWIFNVFIILFVFFSFIRSLFWRRRGGGWYGGTYIGGSGWGGGGGDGGGWSGGGGSFGGGGSSSSW